MLSTPPSALLILVSIALPALVFAIAGWLTRRRGWLLPDWFMVALSGRTAPMVAGAISATLTLFVWGSFVEPGVIHDEQAYLLQARIFASGRWTGEIPPLPEFFEQPHVFVEPTLAAKYPPGHSLFLVPGVWLGLPGLVPLLLAGLTGGLVFTIARRLADPALALLTWWLWSTSAASLFYRASYLSQNTSAALWLLALWALLLWREDARRSRLVVVFACLAWMWLTRPLTAIALAAPIGLWVLMAARRRRLLMDVAIAATVALPIIGLNLLWQERTLGLWLTSPYAEYSRQYFPFVKPGFGVDPTPPLRQRPPEIAWIGNNFKHLHAAHTVRALPGTVVERVIALLLTLGAQWRGFLIPLFVWGVLWTKGPGRLGLISMAALLGGYLVYAHPSLWILYYAEVFPVFFFIAARALERLGRIAFHLGPAALQTAIVVTLVFMAPGLVWDVLGARREHDARSVFHRTAEKTLSAIPDASAVVFIHHPPPYEHDRSLIMNSPDYRSARLWLVYDRGAANARLLGLTPRAAYRLDTRTWTVERIR